MIVVLKQPLYWWTSAHINEIFAAIHKKNRVLPINLIELSQNYNGNAIFLALYIDNQWPIFMISIWITLYLFIDISIDNDDNNYFSIWDLSLTFCFMYLWDDLTKQGKLFMKIFLKAHHETQSKFNKFKKNTLTINISILFHLSKTLSDKNK